MTKDDDWFPNPLDSMPVARYHDWEDTAPSEYEPPRPEEEVADWFVEKPDESDRIEAEKTMHQKMYEMATEKHSPLKGGGSENFQGGSENITQS